jgi:hypothetical protein
MEIALSCSARACQAKLRRAEQVARAAAIARYSSAVKLKLEARGPAALLEGQARRTQPVSSAEVLADGTADTG